MPTSNRRRKGTPRRRRQASSRKPDPRPGPSSPAEIFDLLEHLELHADEIPVGTSFLIDLQIEERPGSDDLNGRRAS